MHPDDLEQVYDIESRTYPQPWSINIFKSELDRADKRVYLVARLDGKVIGYGGLMLVDGEGHITNLAVDKEYRNHGIGTLLALRLIEMAILRRIHWLTLEVRTSNKVAQHLYEEFGFRPVGSRKGYYSDGEDAVIMWTNDIASGEYKEKINGIKKRLEERNP